MPTPPLAQVFREEATGWTVEVMTGLARSLRSVAVQADAELAAARKKAEKLAECLDQLRQLFKAASGSKGSPTGCSSSAECPSSGFILSLSD